MTDDAVYSLIPHRPPFLWVDAIIESTPDTIVAEKTIPADLDVFSGHYPGNPLLPGVLLCEAVFQAGALLIAAGEDETAGTLDNRVPVLTKIVNARFKRLVRPGETIRLTVRVSDRLASVYVLKGSAHVGDELAVKTEFTCAMVAP